MPRSKKSDSTTNTKNVTKSVTKSTTQKTTKTNNETIKEEPSLEALMKMVSSLNDKVSSLTEENKDLKKQLEKKEELVSEEMVEENVENSENESTFEKPYFVNGERRIRVYHMQEMLGGTATVIDLTKTKRRLTRIGELCVFSIEDFEELKSHYRTFFDLGILAVDAGDIDYAQMYDLPIYDITTKATYNSEVLKKVKNYTQEQLRDFYESLSENNKKSFLSFWLGKVYEKEDGYYNVDRLRWLDNISHTQTFAAIIMEMDENERRKNTESIQVK